MSSILIIDSEPQMRQTLTRLFGQKGFQVAAVSHGVEAARIMRHELPQLLLIDQNIPMGGIKTARLLRLNAEYRGIPMLLGLSPGAPEHTRNTLKEAMSHGLAWVLARPYRPEHLLGKVAESLSANGKIGALVKEKAARTTDMEIRKQIRELTSLPTLSATQQRIITLLSCDDDEVDMNELIEIIQTDQALTMRTLKIAKSAGYGFQGNLLPSAVTFLGIQKMRQIVQSATVMDIFSKNADPEEANGLDPISFWTHSLACGMVMQLISRDNHKSKHYMAGLLHDVGKLILAMRFAPYSRAIDEISSKENRPRHLVEREIIGMTHAEIGYEVARLWELPAELSESIYHHHAPSQAGRHRMLTALVYLADIAVRHMGIGHSGNYTAPSLQDTFAQKVRLSMPLEDVMAQRESIAKQIDGLMTTE